MFTVRHIEPNGYEAIHQVKSVWKLPTGPGKVVLASPIDQSEPLRFGTGTLYVMNDFGKTVATYELSMPDAA